jgi:hypothetical protein
LKKKSKRIKEKLTASKTCRATSSIILLMKVPEGEEKGKE